VFNVVKAHRARGGEQQQGDNDDLEQAKALQVQAELLAEILEDYDKKKSLPLMNADKRRI